MIDTLVNRVRKLGELEPEKIAVAFKRDRLSYRELSQKTAAIAAWLGEQGILPGDRVCFSAVSKPEMVAVYLGIQSFGAAAVFLDKMASAESMISICEAAEAKLLLTDKPLKELPDGCRVFSLRRVYEEAISDHFIEKNTVNENELAEILFTTGTTGTPKGVMLSYRAVYHILSNTIRGVGYSKKTILLLPLPMHHSFALRVLRAVLYCGGTVVLQNGFTFAREVEKNITAYSCNALACVPTSYEVMKAQMQDQFQSVINKLSTLEFGAGSLTIAQRREIIKLLPEVHIFNVWGSSETGGAIFCDVNKAVAKETTVGTLGTPLHGEVEIAFLPENAPLHDPEKMRGHLSEWFCDTDEAHPGRMLIRGEMLMSGYWKAETLTESTLIDGWLVTGDLAYQNEQGDLFMLGRADDLINVGGEKVSPVEIENIAGQYEKVKECACIGAADPEGYLGQIPVLFLVTRPGYMENEFVKWLAGQMDKAKMPQKFMTVESIPRNRMQKIDRKVLRQLWENRETLSLMNPVIDAILSRRSIRRFKNQPVPQSVLEVILKCGMAAPSGHNLQSWHFTVLTKEEDIDKLKKAATEAAARKHVPVYGFENPQVIILVSNDERNPDGCQDASCAVENMMLAAHSCGLGSVWLNMLMTLRNEEPVKTLLDEWEIPPNHIVWSAVALGWPVADGIRLQKKTNVVTFV